MLKQSCSPVHTLPKGNVTLASSHAPRIFPSHRQLIFADSVALEVAGVAHHPCRGCLQRGKPLNHREEQDLDREGCVSERLHSDRQVRSMLRLNNDEQQILWDKSGDIEAVTTDDPYKAILPLSQVLYRLVWKCIVA